MSSLISKTTKVALGTPSTANSIITTSWTQINNASVTLNCSGNRPVWIRLIKTAGGLSSNGIFLLYFNQVAGTTTTYGFRLKTDGVVSRETSFSQYLNIASSIHSRVFNTDIINFIVFPTAGSHTFTIEHIGTNIPAGRSPGVINATNGEHRIMAMEL